MAPGSFGLPAKQKSYIEIQQMEQLFQLLALYCRWNAVQQLSAKAPSVGFQNNTSKIRLWCYSLKFFEPVKKVCLDDFRLARFKPRGPQWRVRSRLFDARSQTVRCPNSVQVRPFNFFLFWLFLKKQWPLVSVVAVCFLRRQFRERLRASFIDPLVRYFRSHRESRKHRQ